MSPPPRQRVVLAHRRGARVVRTRVEVEEQTEVGEVLVRGLMRAQLGLALRLGAAVLVILGSLPALFYFLPGLGAAEVFGVRLPWLLLEVLAYPLLIAVGWVYIRQSERNDQDFADMVED